MEPIWILLFYGGALLTFNVNKQKLDWIGEKYILCTKFFKFLHQVPQGTQVGLKISRSQTSYLSKISRIISVEKNLSCGEISNFCKEFEQFMEFYRNLFCFCSQFVWRKICVEKISVEKKWQIWGLAGRWKQKNQLFMCWFLSLNVGALSLFNCVARKLKLEQVLRTLLDILCSLGTRPTSSQVEILQLEILLNRLLYILLGWILQTSLRTPTYFHCTMCTL